MTDYNRSSLDLPGPQRPPPRERNNSVPLNMMDSTQPTVASDNGAPHAGNGVAQGPATAPPGDSPTGPAPAVGSTPGAAPPPPSKGSVRAPEMSKQVQEVLASDIGVSTMINRLKQSITSAKEFAVFLKKRADLEAEHAKGLKKLCKTTQDLVHNMDHRQGSFGQSFGDMLSIHDRMSDNGQQFAMSLYAMHDDLNEISAVAEKHRKGWKQSGLAAEQRLADIEAALRKSKAKYDGLAEDYDRVRTGEKQGGKVFGFKGTKSVAQQEEDLLRKVQNADSEYMGRVQTYQAEKANVVATSRPETIKALQDLIRETDAGTSLQMQKFASFNEKLLLSNGLIISPMKNMSGAPAHHARSLKEIAHTIDNNKDLEDFLLSFYSKVPPKSAEPKYERNPVLNPPQTSAPLQVNPAHQQPPQQQPLQQHPPSFQSQQSPQQPMPPSQGLMGLHVHNPTSPADNHGPSTLPGSMSSRAGDYGVASPVGQHPAGPKQDFGPPSAGPPSSGPTSHPGHERNFSHGTLLSQQASTPPSYSARNSMQGPSPSHQRYGNGGSISQAGAPQLDALPFETHPAAREPSPPRQTGPAGASQYSAYQPGPKNGGAGGFGGMGGPGPSPKQVFGMTLTRLYERDGLAVPMVVYQCIQAVDLYGLAVEGIYRLSGSTTHVQKLKNMFDTDSDSQHLDFRNPENFFHDVNSVAGLLKQFFRDLPDPLLTAEHYTAFIEAAKNEDDVVRRDSMHAIINALPDPSYATLRALTLHLHRVIENSSVTRMNSQNLAIVFGPTLMGTAPGSNIADAGWQVRVVDTILQNTYQIFDED